MKKAQLFILCLFCSVFFAGCDNDPNCSGLTGPPTEELIAQFGGVFTVFSEDLSENDGNFYHFKSVKRFGEITSLGLLASIIREPLGGTAKLTINGNEAIKFSSIDGHVTSSENKSSLITQVFGTQAAITQYYDENTPFFTRNLSFPQEMIVTSTGLGSINTPFYKNSSLQWIPGMNTNNDVYILLLATKNWPVINNSLTVPLYKVIKVSDTGSYQFQVNDFAGFPAGIKFAMYVSRGTFDAFTISPNPKKRLIIATTTARGLFTLADIQ